MNFDEYQAISRRTSSYNDVEFDDDRPVIPGKHAPDEEPRSEYELLGVLHATTGLSGETGEVTDLIKKFVFHGHNLDREKLRAELGDLLWYLSETASVFGLSLDDIAKQNIAKLRSRYPDGFTVEASRNREK